MSPDYMDFFRLLPYELFHTIVSLTLEPWPAYYGMLYNAAIASRYKSPLLLVNKACREIILDELAQTLWLELKSVGPLHSGDLDFMELYSTLDIPSAPHEISSRNRPAVRLILDDTNDRNTSSDLHLRSFTVPFVYQDFAYIFDVALARSYSLDLSLSHLNPRTSEYVDQIIKPLLPFLMSNPKKGAPWNVKIFGERIPHPGPKSDWTEHLENVKLGYHEYQRLRSLSFIAEAQVFASQATWHLIDRNQARQDGCYGAEMFVNYPHSWNLEDALPRIKCKKIMLEFSILAASISIHLYRTDPLWTSKRGEAWRTRVWEILTTPEVYYGLSDLELARWYHEVGLMHHVLGTQRQKGICIFHDLDLNGLAAATFICPENEAWRLDYDEFVNAFREHHGDKWESEWESRYRLKRIEYPVGGGTREWIGVDDGDWRESRRDHQYRELPLIQSRHQQGVEDLERELGIENGDWQMTFADLQ